MKTIHYILDDKNNPIILSKPEPNCFTLSIYSDREIDFRINLERNIKDSETFRQKEGKKSVCYTKYEMSFDIETTQIKEIEKSFMYVGQFSFGNKYGDKFEYLCRTWDDVFYVLELINKYSAENQTTAVIWIANLSYEMSFMLSRFEPEHLELMADTPRKPIYVNYKSLQFRDTLRVSGMSLRNTAKNYCRTQKTELDYSTIRNSLTPLSDTELIYDFNDTRICCEFATYITEQTVEQGLKLPYTQTGILRQYVKNASRESDYAKNVHTLFPKKAIDYLDIMSWLYMGGDTHARCDLVGELIGNTPECDIQAESVQCKDFTSSYPARMGQNDNYPVTPFKRIYTDDIERHNKAFTYWYDITIDNIQAINKHTYISKHKCKFLSPEHIIDNGKIYSAKRIRIYVTEMDYECIKKLYTWSKLKINRAYSALKGRLPYYLLEPVFYFGQKKAELKKQGLSNTPEYATAKAMYNAGYGLMVQKLHLDEIVYKDGKWITQTNSTYNDEIKHQILSPFWGIWVTANARYELIRCMCACECSGSDSVYNDTDSLYLVNPDYSKQFIKRYNAEKRAINKKVFSREQLQYFNDLGELDSDPKIDKFKTLGAKRYVKQYTDKKGFHQVATIAGLPKQAHNEHCKKNNIDFFDGFTNGEIVDIFSAGKLCSKYNDEPYTAIVTDQYGNTETMSEKSGVCLCEIGFEIYMDKDWCKWLSENKKR